MGRYTGIDAAGVVILAIAPDLIILVEVGNVVLDLGLGFENRELAIRAMRGQRLTIGGGQLGDVGAVTPPPFW